MMKMSVPTKEELNEMDESADFEIKGWSLLSLVGNLAPPPFDTIAVGACFAGLGADLAKVYDVEVEWDQLKLLGKSMAKGIGAVVAAGYFGSGLLKWIPGLNIWVALLVQPPIVAAVTYSVGNAFKRYYRIVITEGRYLTPEEMRKLAETEFKTKLGK
jgi:uncharacterized protein (DUF697 family)